MSTATVIRAAPGAATPGMTAGAGSGAPTGRGGANAGPSANVGANANANAGFAWGSLSHAGLGAPILLMVMLGMMVMPLPPLGLDALFTFNIALALVVLLAAVYARRPLDFAAFPTILLVATLLRLALNVASTRVVLLDRAHRNPRRRTRHRSLRCVRHRRQLHRRSGGVRDPRESSTSWW